jgi:uncharacterized membrane protein
MLLLVVGLILFIGMHLTRILAEDWRTRFRAERGEAAWKGVYGIVSLLGLVLIVYGYGQARLAPVWLWHTSNLLVAVAWLLTLIAFVLLAAYVVPNNPIRAAVGHPMVVAVKLWAFSHLLVNGSLADLVLFGSFLLWAVFLYAASRRRDRRDGVTYISTRGVARAGVVVAVGVVAWAVFAMWAHRLLIGVSPIPVT